MSDELKFYRAIQLTSNFQNNRFKIKIEHPSGLLGLYLEVDNIAQKGKTVFVFEGKSNKELLAIKQLKDRYYSLILFKDLYVKKAVLTNYDFIRLFYYSFNRKVITEFDFKGNKILSNKFNDLNELSKILRNI